MTDTAVPASLAAVAADMAAWKRGEIQAQVVSRFAGAWDVPGLVSELLDLDVHDLYRSLCERHGEPTVVAALSALLARDPSVATPEGVEAARLADERPFSRLLVALAYLVVTRCADTAARGCEPDLWANLRAARHDFWPELLWELFGKLHTAEELLPRALDLVCADDSHEQSVGSDLLYGLPLAREVVLAEIDRRLDVARGPARGRLLAARRMCAGSWLGRLVAGRRR